MSRNSIFLGFRIEKKILDQKFGISEPEVSHLEDRFDSKTGQKIAKRKKVVDQPAKLTYQYQNRNFGSHYVELLEHLSHDLHCNWWINYLGRKQEPEVIIGFGDDEMEYQWVFDKREDVETLRTHLEQLGLQPGTASFIQCFSE